MISQRSLIILIALFSSLSTYAAEVLEKEPNDSFQTAQTLQINDSFTFTLKKKGDFDFIKITSPTDGVLRLTQLKKSTAHGWIYPIWMINEKQYHRGGFWGAKVKKNETLYIALRSAEHARHHVASEEKITLKISLESHLAPEPDDTFKQAVPLTIGENFKLQMNPMRDRDFRTFTSPGNGIVIITQLKKSFTHGTLYPWWMVNGKQFSRGGEWSQRVTKGEKVVFGIRSAKQKYHEKESAEVIEFKTLFVPEISEHEPNDSPEQAKEIAIGKEISLLMAPRLDQDFYQVRAPDDGILSIEQLNQVTGIGKLYPMWIEGKMSYRNGEFDKAVKKGELVTFGLRASKQKYHENLSLEPIKIKLHFHKHFTQKPLNNSYLTARQVSIGKPFISQLAPRRDLDFFKVKAPGDGTLKLRQITTSKAHGKLYPAWMVDKKSYTRAGEWDRSVKAGETVTFYVKSSQFHYHEKSSMEQVQLLLSYTPEDSGAEPNNTMLEANLIELGTPFKFQLSPKGDRDYFKFTAVRSGIVRLTRLDTTKAHPSLRIWWGETEDRYMRSEQVMEKRVRRGEQTHITFRSANHTWHEIGSDSSLEFKAEIMNETDIHEPNDVAADATPIAINQPFNYFIIPANDNDFFSITAKSDGVLVILDSNKKPLPHPAVWLEIGKPAWTNQAWIHCKAGKRYLVKVIGTNTGYGSPKSTTATVFSGAAKEFNLIPPTPRKRWSFEVNQSE